MSDSAHFISDDLAAAYGIDPRVLQAVPFGPFTLINLFRLRDRATDAHGVEDGRSGLEAMMQYASVSGPCLDAAGGRFLTTGIPIGNLWGHDDTEWNIVVVAEYPSLDTLGTLLADPRYRAAFADRQAAVAEQRVVVSHSVGT